RTPYRPDAACDGSDVFSGDGDETHDRPGAGCCALPGDAVLDVVDTEPFTDDLGCATEDVGS
ncbi:hypothetical protein, partial [Actinomadura darangshiensis]|uniref:hypothetical protein n=1 Tax=Actinomadura darangshiensis TaxID=705336 RepID=UPI001A9FF64A